MVIACRSIRRLNETLVDCDSERARKKPQHIAGANFSKRFDLLSTCADLLCRLVGRRVCRRRIGRRRIGRCRCSSRRRHCACRWARLVRCGIGSVLPRLMAHPEHNRQDNSHEHGGRDPAPRRIAATGIRVIGSIPLERIFRVTIVIIGHVSVLRPSLAMNINHSAGSAVPLRLPNTAPAVAA